MSLTNLAGKGWRFPPVFKSPLAGPELVGGNDVIKQSILTLLHTNVGERLHHPGFGCGLSNYLFQALDAEILADLREDIFKSIVQYEHRITLNSILFDTSTLYEGTLNINLEYTINQTNAEDNLVFPFYLPES